MRAGLASFIVGGLVTLAAVATGSAAERVSAHDFAGPDGTLDEQGAALYIVYRDNEPLAKFLRPGQTQLDKKQVAAAMAEKVQDLRSKTRHGAPWKWQELDAAFAPPPVPSGGAADSFAWRSIPGLTEKKVLGQGGNRATLGPVRLRKSVDDLPKAIDDAKGATVGYSYNRLAQGGGAWNTEGVVDYPVGLIGQYGTARSLEVDAGPATEWKLAQVQGAHARDVEELTFSLPVTAYLSPGREKLHGTYAENVAAAQGASFSRLWVLQAKPFYETDFDFEHEIYGVQASAEYVGAILGGALALGGYQTLGRSGLQYQLRFLPEVDYSVAERGGRYTSRKPGDDWVRLGAKASFDLRFAGAVFKSLDLGVSYQFLDAVSGSGGFSNLFKAHLTWWLNPNLGPSLDYSKGDTPVADKRIDLLTLGLEVKY